MIEKLYFDNTSHTYYYNGNIVPSVTQILNKKFIPTDEVLQKAHDGSTIHWYCLELFMRTKESITISKKHYHLSGKIKAFVNFVKDHGISKDKCNTEFMVLFNEKDVTFAGTVDLEFNGGLLGYDGKHYIDLKSGLFDKSHALQLAGYKQAGRSDHEWVLYLKDDESYDLIKAEDIHMEYVRAWKNQVNKHFGLITLEKQNKNIIDNLIEVNNKMVDLKSLSAGLKEELEKNLSGVGIKTEELTVGPTKKGTYSYRFKLK